MRAFLGIDPGATGALALYQPETADLTVFDVPTLKIGKKTAVDHYALARIVDGMSTLNPEVWIEYVSASPQMGVTSSFSFGQTYGLLVGVCAAHFLKINTVTPPVWKTAMKAKGDKDESRARVCALLPHHSALFARKKDNGRSDATLIAIYGATDEHPRPRPHRADPRGPTQLAGEAGTERRDA